MGEQILLHDQDDSLRFTESVADFGSLIKEHGAEKVLYFLQWHFPEQADQLFHAYLNSEIERRKPALFRADPPM